MENPFKGLTLKTTVEAQVTAAPPRLTRMTNACHPQSAICGAR